MGKLIKKIFGCKEKTVTESKNGTKDDRSKDLLISDLKQQLGELGRSLNTAQQKIVALEAKELTPEPLETIIYICPNCAGNRVGSILYGYPNFDNKDLMAQVERGEVFFGGCVVKSDNKHLRCNDCAFEFNATDSLSDVSFLKALQNLPVSINKDMNRDVWEVPKGQEYKYAQAIIELMIDLGMKTPYLYEEIIHSRTDVIRKRLKAYRLGVAREIGKPAFVVFSDRTLEDLILKLPRDNEELLTVFGIGENKLSLYGDGILGVIDEVLSFDSKKEACNEALGKTFDCDEKTLSGAQTEEVEVSSVLKIPKDIIGLDKIKDFIKDSGQEEHLEILEDYLFEKKNLVSLKSQLQLEHAIEHFFECKEFFDSEYLSNHFDTSIREARELMVSSLSVGEEHEQLRVKRIERQALECKKCGSKMTLRDSKVGYFWGCSSFPKCYSKGPLTKEQNLILNG
ncbi:HRDC domain-containing protein [Vibrio breoganii]